MLHTPARAGIALICQKAGVLPFTRQSTFALSSSARQDPEGVALRDDEKPRLQAGLGIKKFPMLRNHNLLAIGGTIADAFLQCTGSRKPAKSRSTHWLAARNLSGSTPAFWRRSGRPSPGP